MRTEACTPDEVLAWWFGTAAHDPAAAAGRGALWFGSDARVDDEIRRRFAPTAAAAAAGELDEWSASPRGRLALVVALDQFPRNLYRGTRAAFAQDARAFALSEDAVGSGFLDALSPAEQAFLLMPYEHAESRSVQRRSVALFAAAARRAAREWDGLARGFLGYAREHAQIVERFGRFPHRNAILGRRSTPAEAAYLSGDHASFGQGR